MWRADTRYIPFPRNRSANCLANRTTSARRRVRRAAVFLFGHSTISPTHRHYVCTGTLTPVPGEDLEYPLSPFDYRRALRPPVGFRGPSATARSRRQQEGGGEGRPRRHGRRLNLTRGHGHPCDARTVWACFDYRWLRPDRAAARFDHRRSN